MPPSLPLPTRKPFAPFSKCVTFSLSYYLPPPQPFKRPMWTSTRRAANPGGPVFPSVDPDETARKAASARTREGADRVLGSSRKANSFAGYCRPMKPRSCRRHTQDATHREGKRNAQGLGCRRGTVYPHWAFVPPKRPAVPEIRNPKVEVRNPIDNFAFARNSAKD